MDLVSSNRRLTKSRGGPQPLDAAALQHVFLQSPVPMLVCNNDGQFVAVNEAFAKLLGYARNELVGGRVGVVTHPLDLAEHRERLEMLRSGCTEGLTARKRYLTKDGRTLWGESHSRVIRDASGRPAWIIAQIVDRTEEHMAAEQARESEKQLQAILDNSSAVVFVKDLQGRYILVNRRFEQLHRLVRSSIIGRTDAQLFDKKVARVFRRHDQAVIASGRETQTEEEVLFGSELRTFLSLKFPLRSLDGLIVAVAGMSTDITRRKRAETRLKVLNERLLKANEELKKAQLQLIQAEKLESIGRLAAGVAHEVKNPLALLLMGVEYLENNVPTEDENVPAILKEMREAITRAEKIIVGMVDFSSDRQLDWQTVDLNPVIDGAALLLRHQFTRKSVRLKKVYDKTIPAIRADKTRIEQVLVNLFINSIQAMKKGGRLTVTTSSRRLGEHDRRNFGTRTANPFRAGDRVVVVEIQDTGPGIAPSILPNVFDPFFTTKPTGEGTGLGLSVTRKIVELHEGHIDLINAPGGGLKVTLTFKAQESMLKTSGRSAASASSAPPVPSANVP
jgi:PAS domain S-box-containing protein